MAFCGLGRSITVCRGWRGTKRDRSRRSHLHSTFHLVRTIFPDHLIGVVLCVMYFDDLFRRVFRHLDFVINRADGTFATSIFGGLIRRKGGISAFLYRGRFIFAPIIFYSIFSRPAINRGIVSIFNGSTLLTLSHLGGMILTSSEIFISSSRVGRVYLIRPVFTTAIIGFDSSFTIRGKAPSFSTQSRVLLLLGYEIWTFLLLSPYR